MNIPLAPSNLHDSQAGAAVGAPIPPCISEDPTKYEKRRKQERRRKQRRELMTLMSVTSIVLIWTWWALFDSMDSSPRDDLQMKKQRLQRAAKQLKSNRMAQEVSNGLGDHPTGRKPNSSIKKRGLPAGVDPGFVGKARERFQQLVYGQEDSPRLKELKSELDDLENAMKENRLGGIRWIRPELLISLDRRNRNTVLDPTRFGSQREAKEEHQRNRQFFKVNRRTAPEPMAWEYEPEATHNAPPLVDYTDPALYEYPEIQLEPPSNHGEYPLLLPFGEIMKRWPQDELNKPPTPMKEVLMHFDYTNPTELEAARKFREAKLPFKLINVPEVLAAGPKWTDEYVASHFDSVQVGMPNAEGYCQESVNNFFAFFTGVQWSVEQMGMPPTRNNDWTFSKWAEHARYADTAGLRADQPHFYWQAGVDMNERHKPESEWTFISRDLPSFSSPTETFFVFNPEEQKGIQCRFGERGVTAATHFDSGRNMVAMITGAKRYILSPPNQCSKLGIIQTRGNPAYRHSLLNFGHMAYLDDDTATENGMSQEERAWLERSSEALTVDTVLKAGEVLYIPSHWFHYIVSLQKSAQCNVRSGIDIEGDPVFGGRYDVSNGCVL